MEFYPRAAKLTTLLESRSLSVIRSFCYYAFSPWARFLLFRKITPVRKLPKRLQFIFFLFAELAIFFFWAKASSGLFHLFMEDLSKAVSQFYPSWRGPMNEGFGPPEPPHDPANTTALVLGTEEGRQRRRSDHFDSGPSEPPRKKVVLTDSEWEARDELRQSELYWEPQRDLDQGEGRST